MQIQKLLLISLIGLYFSLLLFFPRCISSSSLSLKEIPTCWTITCKGHTPEKLLTKLLTCHLKLTYGPHLCRHLPSLFILQCCFSGLVGTVLVQGYQHNQADFMHWLWTSQLFFQLLFSPALSFSHHNQLEHFYIWKATFSILLLLITGCLVLVWYHNTSTQLFALLYSDALHFMQTKNIKNMPQITLQKYYLLSILKLLKDG